MTNAKSVWVVEMGSYSDYRVVGVFSSKANAETVAAKIVADHRAHDWYLSDQPTVDEWPIDPVIEELNAGRSLYWVAMYRDGGSHCEMAVYGSSDVDSEGLNFREECRPHNPSVRLLRGHVWATDEQHAIKIANERRVQMIASGAWPDGQ